MNGTPDERIMLHIYNKTQYLLQGVRSERHHIDELMSGSPCFVYICLRLLVNVSKLLCIGGVQVDGASSHPDSQISIFAFLNQRFWFNQLRFLVGAVSSGWNGGKAADGADGLLDVSRRRIKSLGDSSVLAVRHFIKVVRNYPCCQLGIKTLPFELYQEALLEAAGPDASGVE